MDFSLREAQKKFEKANRDQKDRNRLRLERERKTREESTRKQAEFEQEQRLRRLKEIELAEKARLLAEYENEIGGGIRFCTDLIPFQISGEGDKITLPPSSLEKLQSQNALDRGPMFFQLVRLNNGSEPDLDPIPESSESSANNPWRRTHGGVREFTAEEGTVGITAHIIHNLGLALSDVASNDSLIRVRYVRLPKGTHAAVKAMGTDFAEVQNHKAVLESNLRSHSTLTAGDALNVLHAGSSHGLQVVSLRPERAVSLIDTDMEVDLIQSEDDRAADVEKALTQLTLGQKSESTVTESNYRYFKFTLDEKAGDSLQSGQANVVVSIEILPAGTESTDADLYVSLPPVTRPTQHSHHFSSHETGIKSVVISKDGTISDSLSYYVGVYGYRGSSTFQISAQMVPVSSEGVQSVGHGRQGMDFEAMAQEGYLKCGNCRQMVPGRTAGLHEAYCRRHNVACQFPGCETVLRKEESGKHAHCEKCGIAMATVDMAKHEKVFHSLLKCVCGVELEMEAMKRHKGDTCPLRYIVCRFCGDTVSAEGLPSDVRDKVRGLTQHESLCGSRTSGCDVCGRPVPLKEMDLHKEAFHSSSLSRSSFSALDASGLHQGVEGMETDNQNVSVAAMAGMGGFDQIGFEGGHLTDSNFKVSLKVECPICGTKVHSERDLNVHIDLSHAM